MPVSASGNRHFFYTSHMHEIRLIAGDLDGTLLVNYSVIEWPRIPAWFPKRAQDLKEIDFTLISAGKNTPDTEVPVSGLHTCHIRKGRVARLSLFRLCSSHFTNKMVQIFC